MSEAILERRRAGVLLHPTSLPSPFGSGDFGHAAWRFVEFLARAGFSVWQVLPLGPVHSDRSPYNSPSVHAGNPELISLHWLHDRGYLGGAELESCPAVPRSQLLSIAAVRFRERRRAESGLAAAFAQFCSDRADWLPDFALYTALREVQGGVPWQDWPVPLRDRQPAALAEARHALAARCADLCFEQYVFHLQWQELRDWSHRHGVRLFGDVPIFVAPDSAEVWARRDLFRLDTAGHPEVETGVPPDYFSSEGQRWGNPHYDWDAMRRDGFAWWRARLATQRQRFDLLRIDHFRGLEACWEIPRSARSAADGRWHEAPGAELLDALIDTVGKGVLVAENLGLITPGVEALRMLHELPGMRVLQFGFDGDPANPHLPHNHDHRDLVYTGTHDNDTALGWFEALDTGLRAQVLDYLGQPAEAMPEPLLRAALASVAKLAILPLQDVLGLGSAARMNVPGVASGNWGWQLDGIECLLEAAGHMRRLLSVYGRIADS